MKSNAHGHAVSEEVVLPSPMSVEAIRLPDFIIIGAAKSGTTTLHHALGNVSGVFMSNPKEPEFFARDDKFAEGLRAYAELFADAPPGAVCGEASTIYSRHPAQGEHVHERMADVVPGARLIYIVREPVRRAYSDYCQVLSNRMRFGGHQRTNLSFRECVEQIPSVLATSRFGHQLQRVLAFYPREQVLVLDFDELTASPQTTLQRILDFIGVAAPAPEVGRDNTTHKQFNNIVRERMLDQLRRVPFLKAVSRLVPHGLRVRLYDQVATSGLVKRFRQDHTPGEMDDATCRQLTRVLRADTELFGELSGYDVSRWHRTWAEQGWC